MRNSVLSKFVQKTNWIYFYANVTLNTPVVLLHGPSFCASAQRRGRFLFRSADRPRVRPYFYMFMDDNSMRAELQVMQHVQEFLGNQHNGRRARLLRRPQLTIVVVFLFCCYYTFIIIIIYFFYRKNSHIAFPSVGDAEMFPHTQTHVPSKPECAHVQKCAHGATPLLYYPRPIGFPADPNVKCNTIGTRTLFVPIALRARRITGVKTRVLITLLHTAPRWPFVSLAWRTGLGSV